jgi:uncharacterized protein DUF4340
MRWQTTVVVAILLVLVGGYYLLDVEYLGPRQDRREREKNRIWLVEDKSVEELTLRRPQDTVRLRRTADGWQVLEPVSAVGAKGTVDSAVADIVNAKMDREVAAAPGSLAEFGLDKPAAEVTLRVKDKAAPLGLSLGAKNPTGEWVYAKKQDAPGVFVLPELILRDATQPLAEFRDRTLLAFDRKDVTGLVLATPEETIDLARGEPRQWRITRPVTLAADADVVTEFLDKLQFGRVKDFVTEKPPSLAPYGLDHPLRIELRIGNEKDRSTKSLLFGRVDRDKKGVYAMRPGESSVLLVDEGVWRQLPKNVAALRDKTVVAFDRDRLTRIELESPKGPVTLARQGDQWRITAPQPEPADGPVVSGLLFQLRDAKAQAFLPGLHFTPTVKVSLWEADAKTPRVLALAPSTETRFGRPSAYAEVVGQGPPVLVEAQLLSVLSKSAMDLRDHALFSGLETARVTRIRVTRDGQTAVFERSSPLEWRMVEPRRGAARSGRVEDLLLTVAALRWTDILGEGTDAKRYGFDAPALEVMLLGDKGAQLAALTVGKRDGKQYYVHTQAPTVYTVDTTRFGALPKVPDDFRG